MASGEMQEGESVAFLRAAFGNLADNSRDGSIHFIFMDWRHVRDVCAAANRIHGGLKNLIVRVKDNGGMGAFYRSGHATMTCWSSMATALAVFCHYTPVTSWTTNTG